MSSIAIKSSVFIRATDLSNLPVIVTLRHRRLRVQKRHFDVLVRDLQHGKVQEFVTCSAAVMYSGLSTIV
jgi:hypothetical protein